MSPPKNVASGKPNLSDTIPDIGEARRVVPKVIDPTRAGKNECFLSFLVIIFEVIFGTLSDLHYQIFPIFRVTTKIYIFGYNIKNFEIKLYSDLIIANRFSSYPMGL